MTLNYTVTGVSAVGDGDAGVDYITPSPLLATQARSACRSAPDVAGSETLLELTGVPGRKLTPAR